MAKVKIILSESEVKTLIGRRYGVGPEAVKIKIRHHPGDRWEEATAQLQEVVVEAPPEALQDTRDGLSSVSGGESS